MGPPPNAPREPAPARGERRRDEHPGGSPREGDAQHLDHEPVLRGYHAADIAALAYQVTKVRMASIADDSAFNNDSFWGISML